LFKEAYPVVGTGLWQGRRIIDESSALNNLTRAISIY
jgi:hypothetical protein